MLKFPSEVQQKSSRAGLQEKKGVVSKPFLWRTCLVQIETNEASQIHDTDLTALKCTQHL